MKIREMRKLITILGIPVDLYNMDQAIDRMVDFATLGRSIQKSHQVATVNVDFLVKALTDPELRVILRKVDMATVDGMPLVWAIRWLGARIEDRVAGSDFIPVLVERAAREGLSIFFLGAAPAVAKRAVDALKDQHPDLKVAGVLSPPFQPVHEMDPGIVDEIKAADPDILLVAFGNPKQEKWIEIYGPQVNVPLMIGIGGTLDFIAGENKRAPVWMQRMGLEWLHRVLNDPRRLLKRYVTDIVMFSYHFARQWWVQHPRKTRKTQPPKVIVETSKHLPVIKIEGHLTTRHYEEIWTAGQQAMQRSNRILLDLETCTFIDSSVTGAFLGIAKQARDRGGELTVSKISAPVRKIFSSLQLDDCLLECDPTTISPEEPRDSKRMSGGQMEVQDNKGSNLEDPGKYLVKAPRRLDSRSSPSFERLCIRVLKNHPLLVIDLSNTAHLSSTGLATFEKIFLKAAASNSDVRITRCSQDVRQVIIDQNFIGKVKINTDTFAIIDP